MAAFTSKVQADTHSEMLRQRDVAAATKAYTNIGNAGALATFVAAVALADTKHLERLAYSNAQAGQAGANPGVNGNAGHAVTWYAQGTD